MSPQASKLVVIHGKDLKDTVHASKSAEVTAYALGIRKRLRTFSDINRLRYDLIKQGHKIVEDDYIALWKDLAAKGMGSIVYGRGDKPTRFEWHYNMKTVAEAALEGKDVQAERLNSKPDNTIPFPMKKERKKRGPNKPKVLKVLNNGVIDVKHVFIPFRNELLEFKLPLDTTPEQIKTIVNCFKYVS